MKPCDLLKEMGTLSNTFEAILSCRLPGDYIIFIMSLVRALGPAAAAAEALSVDGMVDLLKVAVVDLLSWRLLTLLSSWALLEALVAFCLAVYSKICRRTLAVKILGTNSETRSTSICISFNTSFKRTCPLRSSPFIIYEIIF